MPSLLTQRKSPIQKKSQKIKSLSLSKQDDQSVTTIKQEEEEEEEMSLETTSNDSTSKTTDIENLKLKLNAFREMAWPYFSESTRGRWLFAGMVGMTLLNSGVSVVFSYLGRDFWSALSSKDVAAFDQILLKYSAVLLAGTPVAVLYKFQREKLALAWREWMTDRTMQLYYSNRAYYIVERGNEVDNPDQRIAEDVNSFTAFSLSLFITVVTSVIDLVSFSFILYSIQPSLFGAIVGYAAFGTVITAFLGRDLVGLNFLQLRREADFRYLLVRIRENAESIAFYGGEDIEGKEVSNRLSKVVENKREIIKTQRNLEFFTTAYSYLVQVFPIAVVAPRYFAGAIELGVISQSVGAFNHILRDLSIIVNQFEGLSSFTAGIDRLYQFMLAIKEADPHWSSTQPNSGELLKFSNATAKANLTNSQQRGETAHTSIEMVSLMNIEEQTYLENSTISLIQKPPSIIPTETSAAGQVLVSIDHLNLLTPDRKRLLIEDLTMSIYEGENLLIMGDSGAGKSSLLRAIAGLWNAGSGSIIRPSDSDVYFLPQRPYCALGSLKDQLLYPSLEEMNGDDYPEGHKLSRAHLLRQSLKDEDLLKVLEDVNLKDLPMRFGDGDPIKGLSVVLDWSNTLSLGEQQRLAFGRLLVNKPRLVILDEATSALDIASEEKMYKLLKQQRNRGVSLTYISVGHRPTLVNFHEKKLNLGGAGKQNTVEKLQMATLS